MEKGLVSPIFSLVSGKFLWKLFLCIWLAGILVRVEGEVI